MRPWSAARVLLLLGAGCPSAPRPTEPAVKEQPPAEIVAEKPGATPAPPDEGFAYDLVVSETAVGRYAGVTFTVAGLAERPIDGTPTLTTYLDLDKTRFVDVVEGTTFELKPGVTLQVVRIAKPPGEKGRLWFREVRPTP